MLDAILKLAESITEPQATILKKSLGDSYDAFQKLMVSETEADAVDRLSVFRSEVKSIPITTLLALHGELTDDQRAILSDLL